MLSYMGKRKSAKATLIFGGTSKHNHTHEYTHVRTHKYTYLLDHKQTCYLTQDLCWLRTTLRLHTTHWANLQAYRQDLNCEGLQIRERLINSSSSSSLKKGNRFFYSTISFPRSANAHFFDSHVVILGLEVLLWLPVEAEEHPVLHHQTFRILPNVSICRWKRSLYQTMSEFQLWQLVDIQCWNCKQFYV